MRLLARSIGWLERRLHRSPRTVVAGLGGAAIAVGFGAGAWDRDATNPSRAAVEAADVEPVASSTAAGERQRGRGGPAYYRRTARKRVPAETPAEFLPLYREAERVYGVNWRLIASIHRQETAFSTAPSTYHGLNPFGCCAGPMQFNVTNGPVSTWKRYRQAFRAGRRPKRYPHRTRTHPSIYDDFDAIMAAGSLLSHAGAGRSLDAGAWTAAYDYYGHDLFGVTYANQVLARAVAWQRDGFCPNCNLDEVLVAKFEKRFGASVRRQLMAAERRHKKHRKHKKHAKRKKDKKDESDRRRRRKRGDHSDDRARHRSRKRRSAPPSAKKEVSIKPSPPGPPRGNTDAAKPPPHSPATPPTTAPPPQTKCSPIRRLLGCKP